MVFSLGSPLMRYPCVLLLWLRPSTSCVCVCRFTSLANSGIWWTACVCYGSVCVGVGWPPAGCIRWDCLLGEYRIFHTVWAAWAVMYLWCIHLIVLIKVQPTSVVSRRLDNRISVFPRTAQTEAIRLAHYCLWVWVHRSTQNAKVRVQTI